MARSDVVILVRLKYKFIYRSVGASASFIMSPRARVAKPSSLPKLYGYAYVDLVIKCMDMRTEMCVSSKTSEGPHGGGSQGSYW